MIDKPTLLQDMDLIKWRQDLEQDSEELAKILKSAKVITPQRDNKLQTLKNHIVRKIENPINPGNGKIIIFIAKGCKKQQGAMKCTTPSFQQLGAWEQRKREPYSAQVFAERNGFQHTETERAETDRRLG